MPSRPPPVIGSSPATPCSRWWPARTSSAQSTWRTGSTPGTRGTSASPRPLQKRSARPCRRPGRRRRCPSWSTARWASASPSRSLAGTDTSTRRMSRWCRRRRASLLTKIVVSVDETVPAMAFVSESHTSAGSVGETVVSIDEGSGSTALRGFEEPKSLLHGSEESVTSLEDGAVSVDEVVVSADESHESTAPLVRERRARDKRLTRELRADDTSVFESDGTVVSVDETVATMASVFESDDPVVSVDDREEPMSSFDQTLEPIASVWTDPVAIDPVDPIVQDPIDRDPIDSGRRRSASRMRSTTRPAGGPWRARTKTRPPAGRSQMTTSPACSRRTSPRPGPYLTGRPASPG